MASFGKVLDLFDDRYLQLHDVTGNAEPLPTLVPYEEYMQNVLVYRIDANHEIFMALMQNFTERTALEKNCKELWTWCVQWEVEAEISCQSAAFPHSPKKPRLQNEVPQASTAAQNPQRKAPAIDIIERRVIDPGLMREEDMLRILIDIVQVDSTIVPNFIEFLYRWIDYYEGDGKALKAAMRWEIPSLWDFEYHPLVLSDELKKKAKAMANAASTKPDTDEDEAEAKAPNSRNAEMLAQGSPTKKMREKPDLAAMERQTEESERLQYREVHYGIQPRKLSEPIPPLINVPRDQYKRNKYYAACFKSRQRAFNLLIEAGITTQQIGNYQKCQEEHPRETPQDGHGGGLKHYQKDAKEAQKQFVEKEKLTLLRTKQMEIAISNNLAIEASLAARSARAGSSSGVPLIPPTPSYTHRSDNFTDMLRVMQAAKSTTNDRINVVPKPLLERMKSKLFEGAKERGAFTAGSWPQGQPNVHSVCSLLPTDDQDMASAGGDEDTDMDDEDGSGPGGSVAIDRPPMNVAMLRPAGTTTLPPPSGLVQLTQPFPLSVPLSGSGPALPLNSFANASNLPNIQQQTPYHNGASSTAAAVRPALTQASIGTYMRNLDPDQAQRLLPHLNQIQRQALIASLGTPSASSTHQAPVATPHSTGIAGSNTNAHIEFQTPRTASPLPPPLPPPPPSIMVHSPYAPYCESPDRLPPGFENQTNVLQAHRNSAYSLPQGRPHTALASMFQPPSLNRSIIMNDVPSSTHEAMSSYPAGYNFGQPRSNLTQLPHLPQLRPPPFYPTPPGLSSPVPPLRFSQQPVAAQMNSNALLQQQSQQIPRSDVVQTPLPSTSFMNHMAAFLASERQRQVSQQARPMTDNSVYALPSPQPLLTPLLASPPRPGVTRTAPSPLTLVPPPQSSALATLGPHLLATSPFTASPHGIPVQIYFPKIVVPGNTLGPGGKKMGDNGVVQTDALLIGHCQPGSGKIVLSKAIFLPAGVWENTLRKVRNGKYEVLETYPAPATFHFVNFGAKLMERTGPHRSAYTKLAQAYSLMSNTRTREHDLTKRWRTSRGPTTLIDRGAVWEGWAVYVDKEIELSASERKGAVLSSGLIDEGVERKVDEEAMRRRREMDELMDEDDYEDFDIEMEVSQVESVVGFR